MRRVAIDPVLSVAHAYEEGVDVTLCLMPVDPLEVGDVAADGIRTISLCAECRIAE